MRAVVPPMQSSPSGNQAQPPKSGRKVQPPPSEEETRDTSRKSESGLLNEDSSCADVATWLESNDLSRYYDG